MKEETPAPGIIAKASPLISPEMIILDIISEHRQTEPLFKRLEEETGTCVLCEGLFLSLADAARQFGFDLDNILTNLHAVLDDKNTA
jgi:hypothetical protein